jgi:hypothetical protein
MTIFDIIGGILFTKKKDILDNVDDQKQFQPFIVNRWLSMHSGDDARIVNETVNKFGHVFTDKADLYKFLVNVLPRHRFKRINYIKKKKNELA